MNADASLTRPLPAHLTSGGTELIWQQGTRQYVPAVQGPPGEHAGDLFAVGQRLGDNYEIRRLLGSGGMGQVYEAHDQLLNRQVAIKVAWPWVPASALRREAQVLAAFRIGSLPIAYALGSHGGTEFLVLEQLRGSLLSEHLMREGALEPEEAIDLLATVCEALSPIHECGLAHCDLKPANIMLVPGRVVLFDFGIVRIEQEPAEKRPIHGSAHYMAPEAIRGEVGRYQGHLVDIYALGVMAFVMLTGIPPYQHPRIVEIMAMHLYDRVPHIREIQPRLSCKLDALVEAMMAKLPDQRPSRVEDVRLDLIAARGR